MVAGPMSTPSRSPMPASPTASTSCDASGVDAIGHDVVDRQLELDAARRGVGFDAPRFVELVVFDERLADRHAARLEERVGHRAADEQAVDLAEQILDHLDLVGDLGAAEDRDERPLRRLERVAEILQLLLHQQPGGGLLADDA